MKYVINAIKTILFLKVNAMKTVQKMPHTSINQPIVEIVKNKTVCFVMTKINVFYVKMVT